MLPGDLQGVPGSFMKIPYMLLRGWRILIPHDDMKISDMLFPISI